MATTKGLTSNIFDCPTLRHGFLFVVLREVVGIYRRNQSLNYEGGRSDRQYQLEIVHYSGVRQEFVFPTEEERDEVFEAAVLALDYRNQREGAEKAVTMALAG